MKVLLSDRFVINTNKTSDQIMTIIKDNVDTKHPYIMRRYNSKTFFYGIIKEDKFWISICSKYRNSFSPIINGMIIKDGDSTKVELQMKLRLSVKILLTIWLSMMIFFECILLCTLRYSLNFCFMLPLLMACFVYLLSYKCFWNNVNKARQKLHSLL